MTAKLSPALVRAIASTHLHGNVYTSLDHLLQHGATEYIRRRNDAGDGRIYCVAISRTHPSTITAARDIVDEHVSLVNKAMTRPGAGPLDVCRAIVDADAVMLEWWCEQMADGEPPPRPAPKRSADAEGDALAARLRRLTKGDEGP